MHATPPTCLHALQIQTNIMYTTLLLAPLTPILQPPKQKRTPLAESYRGIFSATVVVETAEKRGQKWKRCDSSFSSSVEETHQERTEIDNEEGAADRGSFSINKILAFLQSESVCLCLWGIKSGRVYAQCMHGCVHPKHALSTLLWQIVEAVCFQAILGIREWLMKKALISQRREKEKNGDAERRAEICKSSMPLLPRFQSWLRQITLPILHWHIWDGFISLGGWMCVCNIIP